MYIRDAVPATAYQNEIVNPSTTNTTDNATTYSAKIGLMYVSDYGFAASPSAWTITMYNYDTSTATSNNWMHMGYHEWTISRFSNYSDYAFYVTGDGFVDNLNVGNSLSVRPSFTLLSSVSYASGSGTQSDPIRIV